MIRLFSWLDLPRTVFVVLLLWVFYSLGLSDPDYFWHLKAGEYIATQGFPAGDPFSYTFEGKPWVLHEWLFELLLYGVSAYFGDFGIKALTAYLAVAAVYISYLTANRVLQGSTLAMAMTIVLIFFQAMAIAPRPQLVTTICFALLVYLIVAFKYFNDDRRLWIIPPVMIVWVNCHGGFVVGVALLGLFLAFEWLRRLVFRRDDIDSSRLIRFTTIAMIGVLATAANPDFVRHWLYPFEVMNLKFAISIIQEWQSPNFQTLQNKLFLAFVFLFFIAYIYRSKRPDLTEIGLPLFFLSAAFVSIRHVPVAMLVLIPLAAVAIRDTGVLDLYKKHVSSGTQLGTKEITLNWSIVVVVCAIVAIALPSRQVVLDQAMNARLPVKALAFVKANGITGKIFNEYSAGGYLIYSLFPAHKVFIDGRADVYGDRFLREYVEIYSGGPRWEEALAKHDIDVLITPVSAPIRQLLLMRGDYRAAYKDDFHSVLVKQAKAVAQTESFTVK